jgi:hypothetical protein
MVELRKIIETGRLVGVAWRGLFSGLFGRAIKRR